MSLPLFPIDLASLECRQLFFKVAPICLPLLAICALGCGSSAVSKPQAPAIKQDPVGEFEWGIERLDRALRVFKPSSSDGLNVTDRKLDYKLIPPSDTKESYSARVTITTEASFLHAKRRIKEDEKPAEESKEPENEDLLAKKEDIAEFIDIPGAGPQAPSTPATRIEQRSRETETVFELIYVDGRWKLAKEPERKYEQLWFEYAFE